MRHMRRMRLTALLMIVRIPLSQENPEDLQVLSRVWLMILSNPAIKRRKIELLFIFLQSRYCIYSVYSKIDAQVNTKIHIHPF